MPERKEAVRVLEIGSFEGRSTVALKNLFCKKNDVSKVVTIDHFDCTDVTAAGLERYRKIRGKKKIDVWPTFSADAMHELKCGKATFHLAYVDGSHHRLEVMDDALAAWRCLEKDGCLIFDDYEWDRGDPNGMDHPHGAINAFLDLVGPEADVVWRRYQVIVKKTTGGPRHDVFHHHDAAFVIALVADEAYAAAAAVAIRSVVMTCSTPSILGLRRRRRRSHGRVAGRPRPAPSQEGPLRRFPPSTTRGGRGGDVSHMDQTFFRRPHPDERPRSLPRRRHLVPPGRP